VAGAPHNDRTGPHPTRPVAAAERFLGEMLGTGS
jgi:hypothetical protein